MTSKWILGLAVLGTLIAPWSCGAQEDEDDEVLKPDIRPCNSENVEHLLEGLRPWLTIHYTATEKQWPELKRLMNEFGTQASLEKVDYSAAKPDIRIFEIRLCNGKGTVIRTRHQVLPQYSDPKEPQKMTTFLYQRGRFWGWRDLGEELVREFEKRGWKVETSWIQPRLDINNLYKSNAKP